MQSNQNFSYVQQDMMYVFSVNAIGVGKFAIGLSDSNCTGPILNVTTGQCFCNYTCENEVIMDILTVPSYAKLECDWLVPSHISASSVNSSLYQLSNKPVLVNLLANSSGTLLYCDLRFYLSNGDPIAVSYVDIDVSLSSVKYLRVSEILNSSLFNLSAVPQLSTAGIQGFFEDISLTADEQDMFSSFFTNGSVSFYGDFVDVSFFV